MLKTRVLPLAVTAPVAVQLARVSAPVVGEYLDAPGVVGPEVDVRGPASQETRPTGMLWLLAPRASRRGPGGRPRRRRPAETNRRLRHLEPGRRHGRDGDNLPDRSAIIGQPAAGRLVDGH